VHLCIRSIDKVYVARFREGGGRNRITIKIKMYLNEINKQNRLTVKGSKYSENTCGRNEHSTWSVLVCNRQQFT